MRVLICDDHVVFAESLAHLLTARGDQVVAVVHDPDEALAVLRREQVDVFLLDLMYGRETVLHRLGELCAATDAGVVLLSGRLDDQVLLVAREAGVRGVADKRQPFTEILGVLARVHSTDHLAYPARRWGAAAHRPTGNPLRRLADFLTPRERQTLCALVRGEDTRALARSLGVSRATARSHVQSVLNKLGAHSRLEAATAAVRNGVVHPETGAWLS